MVPQKPSRPLVEYVLVMWVPLDALLALRACFVDLLLDLPPGRVVLVCSDPKEDFDVGPKRRLFLFVLVRF